VIPSVYLNRLFAAHVQTVPHYYIPLPPHRLSEGGGVCIPPFWRATVAADLMPYGLELQSFAYARSAL
jgi:hypothetical protein